MKRLHIILLTALFFLFAGGCSAKSDPKQESKETILVKYSPWELDGQGEMTFKSGNTGSFYVEQLGKMDMTWEKNSDDTFTIHFSYKDTAYTMTFNVVATEGGGELHNVKDSSSIWHPKK